MMGPRPPRVGWVGPGVGHLHDVADRVVQVPLEIDPHCGAVAGMLQSNSGGVRRTERRRREARSVGGLAEMLSPGGGDQLVNRVIREFPDRIDAAVAEIDCLLSAIAQVRDVPGGVVGVVQILDAARRILRIQAVGRKRRAAAGKQIGQSKRLLVAVVFRARPVAELNQFPLPLRVVVDVGDEGGRRGRTLQIDVDSL